MEIDIFKQLQIKDFLEYLRKTGKKVTQNEFEKAKFRKEDIEWAYENLNDLIAEINKEVIDQKEKGKVFKSKEISFNVKKQDEGGVEMKKELKEEFFSNIKEDIDKYLANKYLSKEDIKIIVKEVLKEELQRFLELLREKGKEELGTMENVKNQDQNDKEEDQYVDDKNDVMYYNERLYFEFKDEVWKAVTILKSGKKSVKNITPDAVMILFDILMDLYREKNTIELTYNDVVAKLIKFYNIRVKVENFSKGKTRKYMHRYYYYPLKLLEIFQVIEHKDKKIKLFNKLPRDVVKKWTEGDFFA